MECDVKSPAAAIGRDLLRDAAARPVALVGLMGAGKTTVGRRLAARLGLPFADADAEIETASGMAVAEIFERFGETYFRAGERRVIARLIEGETKVIATGGGAFMQDETRALLRERAVTVWLDADIATLAERVRKRHHRPLLRDRDPLVVLTELAAVRNPVYAEAALKVNSRHAPHDVTVAAIIRALAAVNAAAVNAAVVDGAAVNGAAVNGTAA